MKLTSRDYIHYSQVIRKPYKDRRSMYLSIKDLYLIPPSPPEFTFDYQNILSFLTGRKNFILKIIEEEGEFSLSLVDLLRNNKAYLPPKVLKKFHQDIEKHIRKVFSEIYLAYIISDCDIILIMKRKSRV